MSSIRHGGRVPRALVRLGVVAASGLVLTVATSVLLLILDLHITLLAAVGTVFVVASGGALSFHLIARNLTSEDFESMESLRAGAAARVARAGRSSLLLGLALLASGILLVTLGIPA
ncbi:MAG TPA: hypothetical protein VH866_11420 [Candidatus Deferrimicrobiaceae bacterium]|jgi:hypothetical protein